MKLAKFEYINNNTYSITLVRIFSETEDLVFYKEKGGNREWRWLNNGEYISPITNDWIETLNWAVDHNIKKYDAKNKEIKKE